MTTAFVLSGGGSLGAVQVGMLRALTDRDIVPDLLIGTSAGALNAAFVAGYGTGHDALNALEARWIATRRSDVFPLGPRQALRVARGADPALCSPRGLSRLIASNLIYEQFDQTQIPLHVIATDLLSGREVVLSTGDVASAILASASIPGLLPPVLRDGLTLVDGGLADNAAISVAAELGADRVYVLPTGYSCALQQAPTSALGVAMQSLGFLLQQRLLTDISAFGDRVELHVLPPPCPMAVSSIDFNHARELIDSAHAVSSAWFDGGGLTAADPLHELTLHQHRVGASPERRR
ncbi:MAG: patatin-like phospholipase family protein [Jatrophihabitantaceae bacterium]